MTAIVILIFAAAAGFAVVVIATTLVIIGVRQEERRQTLMCRKPPTIPALLARRVLGSQFDTSPDHRRDEHHIPQQVPSNRWPDSDEDWRR